VPFLINEDNALKALLKGMTVSDDNEAARKVGVWFNYPDPEEVTVTYPFVTISLVDIEEAPERAHRGRIKPSYVPEGYEAIPGNHGQSTEYPIPVDIYYQITTYARSAWHDRYIQAQLIGNRLPLRFGALEVEADDTIRRLDRIGFQDMDRLDRNQKRLFSKAHSIKVSSELFPEEVLRVRQVASVHVDLVHQFETFVVDQEPAA